MNSWARVIVEWTNCLGIIESTIESIDDLRDGTFYERLVTQLCLGNEENFTLTTKKVHDKRESVLKFIQAEYPEFGSIDCTNGISKEVYIASLLLVQCSQQPLFHRPMCVALNHETQIQIKRFLEMVLPCGKNLTRDSLEAAITELGDVASSDAPSTPIIRPLREFFNSPAVKSARTQRYMNERNRELICLRAQLETEQFEKADLVEDLRIQGDKMANLQKKLDEKTRELREMRMERLKPPTPQSCRKAKRPSDNEERYRREAESLETINFELVAEIEKLRDEREELARRLNTSERLNLAIREKYEQTEKSAESLANQLETKNNELLDLRMNSEELRERIRQMKRISIGEQSFDTEPICDEALSSIVDIQLQEARNETYQLENKLAEVRHELEASLRDCEKLRGLEIILRDKTLELDNIRSFVCEMKQELSTSNARGANLELEKSRFLEELTKLEARLCDKDELLNVTEKRKNELERDLEIVSSRARDLEISLVNEKSRINKLKSNVELAEIEAADLRKMLSSREEELSLVTGERENLKLILDETRLELEETRILLKNEKTSVKSLETIVASCNEESEDLRNKLASSEEQILQVKEEKKLLESNLVTIVRKLEKTESCLNNERSRGEDLKLTLVKANGEIEDLKNLLRSSEKFLNDERTRIEELELIIRRDKSDNEALQVMLDELKITLASEKEGSEELREIVSRSKKTSEELETLLQSKEELLDKSTKRESTLNNELESCKSRINDLNNMLHSETSRSLELETQIFHAKKNCADLEAELASKENLLSKKMIYIEIKISEYERRIKDLDESSLEKTKKLNVLQSELTEKNTALDSLRLSLYETEKREIAMADCLRESEKKIAELNELGEEMESQMAQELQKSTILRDENENLNEKLSGYVRLTNDLKEKIVKIEKKLEKTRENMQKETAMSQELGERVKDLGTANNELEEKLKKEKNQLTSIMSEKDGLEEELASYVSETSIMRQRIEKMEQELEQSHENLAKEFSSSEELRKKVEDSRTRQNELEEKLIKEKNRFTSVLMERDDLKKELASYVSEISIMRQRIEKMEQELEQSHENLAKESSSSEELRKKVEVSRTRQKELEEILINEKNQFTSVLTERDDLKKELVSYVSEISIMRQRIEKMEQELEQSHENLAKESSSSEKLRKKVEDSRTRQKELEEILINEKNQFTSVLTERDDLKKELVSYVSETSIMRQRIEKMEQELEQSHENLAKESLSSEELRKKVEDSRTRQKELEEILINEKNQFTSVLTERDDLKKELVSYVSEISIMRQRIEKMEQELEQSRENLTKEFSSSEALRKKVEDSRTRQKELEEILINEKNQLTSVLTERDDLKKELVSYVSEISIMRQRIEKMEQELEQSHEYLAKESSMSEELRKKVEDSRTRQKELEEILINEKNQFTSVLAERDDLKRELVSYVSEISIMRQRIEKMEQELEQSHENLAKESSSSEELRKKVEDSRTRQKELEEILINEKNQYTSVLTERDDLKEELASYVSKTSVMGQRIDDMERELEKLVANLQKQTDSNSALDKRELESSELREKLYVELAQEREMVKSLETEKAQLEKVISSFARSKADMIEEISALHKELEGSRNEQQNLLSTSEKECAKLRQRITELTEESKLRIEAMRSVENELEDMRLEKERLTEKIQFSSVTATSLEKRLVAAENSREEVKLEDKLKEEALSVVRARLEQLGKEKIESELKMKELILNLQEVRSSQDQVLEAQVKAIEEKSRQLVNCERELQELKDLLIEKTSELESEKSKVKNFENEIELLRIKCDGESTLVKELQSSLELERRKHLETTINCESLSNKISEIERLSKILKIELNALWDSVRDACPELAQPRDEALDDLENPENVVASFVRDAKTIRKAVSILGEANETLKEHLDGEKETAKIISEEAKKRKLELAERLSNAENELAKRDQYLSLLARRKKDLQGLLSKAVTERDKVDDEIVHLMERWKLLNFEARSLLTTEISASDEFEKLRTKHNELDDLLASFSERHVHNSKTLLKSLCRIFLWSENKLQEVHNVSILSIKEEFSPETVLSEEIQRDEIMRRDLAKVDERMNEFLDCLKSCEARFKAGLIKVSTSKEEKLQAQLDEITKERKVMKDKLDAARVRNAKMEKNMDELRSSNKKLKMELSEAITAEERGELERLRALTEKLEEEKADLSRRINDGGDVDARLETVHNEYGQKLEKIKQKMKTAYNEQIAKLNQEQEKAIKDKMDSLRAQTEQQCRKYTEDIAKYKAHISDLSSRYWDVGEKLLAETQDKQAAIQQLQRLRGQQQHQVALAEVNEELTQSRHKTASLDRREFAVDRATRDSSVRAGYRAVEVIEEETTTFSKRRHSVKSIQAMGNAFNAEDEEGEVFDSIFLADLKEGRCAPLAPDFERLSELRMRNSMCRPHLKSSYAVETHLQPVALNEDDIKNGVTGDDVFNDSLSQSLLPGQKPKKKDRTQTSYKRPGPPTPSKNGGRLSLQGNELKSPNSRILKERNVDRRTTATPRGLKNLFGTSMSKRQDENTLGTPKGRRLSNIFRKQRTERN